MSNVLLGNKEVGSIIKLKENGVLVDFYVAKHDYESGINGSGHTLVVRKDCYDTRAWHSSNVNDWADCTLLSWYNGDYLNLLDEDIRGVIGTTKYYYTPGNYTTSVTTRSDAVFQLSATELGKTPKYANTEGTALPIASTLQIAYLNGSAVIQWTRSPNTEYGKNACCFTATGIVTRDSCANNHGSRPAFTLPYTLYVSDDGTVFVNTPPSISGADGDIGTFSATAPIVAYTVTDEDGDDVTVTIKLDGVAVKTHAVTLGEDNTWQLTGVDWLKVLNGAHTVTIIADDGYVQSERTYTFTKSVTSMSFKLSEPLPADDMITKAIESIIGVIPANATTKIEACNNGYDASPTWQDVTQKVLAGEKFQLTNTTKTADNWGYNVRVTVSRGSATGDIYINSMGGFFE